jgi:LysM repeat protein
VPEVHVLLMVQSPTTKTYTVEPGDSLYSIAKMKDIDMKRLAELNDIKLQPRVKICPGQELRLP